MGCIDNADEMSSQVLYNKDCVSDQAIIYWHQKGSKPQGRQHFLTATESLVKVRLSSSMALFSPFLTRVPTSSCRSRKIARKSRVCNFTFSRVTVLHIGLSVQTFTVIDRSLFWMYSR